MSQHRRLRDVAVQMREQHGPDHERHQMWNAIADWLENEAVSARRCEIRSDQISDEAMTNVEPKYDPSTLDAIAVANAYAKGRGIEKPCYTCQQGVTQPHRCPITLAELTAVVDAIETSA